MSEHERIVIVGSNAFAESVAEATRQSPDASLVGVIRSSQPFPTSASLVLCLEEPSERVGVVKNAVAIGFPVVSLPLPDSGKQMRMVARAGVVAQVSPLRGFAAIEELRVQVKDGALGQAYGLFATHRVSRVLTDPFGEIGVSLLAVVLDLLDAPVERVQVTHAALHGESPDAWFVIARTQSGFLVTVEFGRLLPPHAPQAEQLLLEATGSEMVLRAEPTRQAVSVITRRGRVREPGWWTPLAEGFLRAALAAVKQPDAEREDRLLSFVAAVRRAEESGQPEIPD